MVALGLQALVQEVLDLEVSDPMVVLDQNVLDLVVAPDFEVAALMAVLALPPGLLNLSVTPVRDLAVLHSRSLT